MFCHICQGIAQRVQFSRKILDKIELSCKIDAFNIFHEIIHFIFYRQSGHQCCLRVSVHLSVTSRHFTKMAKCKIIWNIYCGSVGAAQTLVLHLYST